MKPIETTFALLLVLESVGCGSIETSDITSDDVEIQNEDTATQLVSLEELMVALEEGREVTATLRYGECILDGTFGPDAVGGMKVETYEWFAAGLLGNDVDYVAFSKSSLIVLYNDHVYDYVKVRVFDDGYVQIIAQYLDVDTFSVQMHEEFDCELDEGEGGSVSLWMN